MIYLTLLYVTLIVVFVVDLSGFSRTVLDVASRIRHRRIVSLRPFTCSLCMTWWVTLVTALFLGELTLPVAAYCAALAFASATIADAIIFINEALKKFLNVLCKILKI